MNRPVYVGTPDEQLQQTLAVLSEGHCPFCGDRLSPYEPPADLAHRVKVGGWCARHGLFVVEPDGMFGPNTMHHTTPHGLNTGGWEWWAQ